MLKLKVNKKLFHIKTLSELTTKEFCLMADNLKVFGLGEYISLFVGQDITNQKVETNVSFSKIESLILDEQIDFTKIKCPETIQFRGEDKLVKDLDDGTFSKRYMYDIFKQQFIEDKISSTHLVVLALALMLVGNDTNEINKAYEELLEMNWRKVLPVGFFLTSRLNPNKNFMMKFFKTSIIRFLYILRVLKLKATHKILLT